MLAKLQAIFDRFRLSSALFWSTPCPTGFHKLKKEYYSNNQKRGGQEWLN